MTEEEKIFNEFNQSDEFNDLRINIVDTIFNMVQAKTNNAFLTQVVMMRISIDMVISFLIIGLDRIGKFDQKFVDDFFEDLKGDFLRRYNDFVEEKKKRAEQN